MRSVRPDEATLRTSFATVKRETADTRTVKAIDAFEQRFGPASAFVFDLASSPAALEGYTALTSALAKGSLRARLREQIALLVAERNACAYCLAAHEKLAARVGLSEAEIAASLQARADDAKADAALKLAAAMVDGRGHVSDEELARVRAAGLGDAEIAEVAANVALNVFRNYFALAARPRSGAGTEQGSTPAPEPDHARAA
jgi:AhpD family alkylhydroperoxidase